MTIYANPYAGVNLLPSLSPGCRRPGACAIRRASATDLAAVHAAWRAADQARAEASLPAYVEIDYATFRQQVDRPDPCAPTQYVITHGNCMLIAGQQREVLAKLALPWIDHWGAAHGARYFVPTKPCKIPLRAWLSLATARLFMNAAVIRAAGGALKLFGSPLLKLCSSCKTAGSYGRAVLRRLANSARHIASNAAAQHAARRIGAAHGEPHWTTIRLTA